MKLRNARQFGLEWLPAVVFILFAAVTASAQTGVRETVAAATDVASGATPYDATLGGKSCKDNPANQSIDCEYKVGTGLHFIIEGLGRPDTGISFLKSSADGDFYASFGVLHGCVIVGRGERSGPMANAAEFAFVSPKNGKVYKTWEECKEGW